MPSTPLVFIPTEDDDTFVNPDHVVSAVFHAGRNDLRIILTTGSVVRVDGEHNDLAKVLQRLGYDGWLAEDIVSLAVRS